MPHRITGRFTETQDNTIEQCKSHIGNMFTPCQPLVTQNMQPVNAISSNICAPSQLSVANYQTTITSNMFTPCQPLVTQNMEPANAISSNICAPSQLSVANYQTTITINNNSRLRKRLHNLARAAGAFFKYDVLKMVRIYIDSKNPAYLFIKIPKILPCQD
ncbi:unnamed protein product [Gordionus sp. m RMFG-2023]